jgi:hypothetical protein
MKGGVLTNHEDYFLIPAVASPVASHRNPYDSMG